MLKEVTSDVVALFEKYQKLSSSDKANLTLEQYIANNINKGTKRVSTIEARTIKQILITKGLM